MKEPAEINKWKRDVSWPVSNKRDDRARPVTIGRSLEQLSVVKYLHLAA